MSSLWTPGGEHPIDRPGPGDRPPRGARPGQPRPGVSPGGAGGPLPAEIEEQLAAMSPEDRERAKQMAAQMQEVREQLASVPASTVITNHVMGLFELAAVHLSSDPPAVDEARLAIDAMGAVIDGLQGRLGENEGVMRDSLGQIRMAYVQVKTATQEPFPSEPPPQ